MTELSPRLELPYLMPSQAQKHITHNEALELLDAIVQLTLVSIGENTPPGAPQSGEAHGVGEAPTGAWAGHSGQIAVWRGTGWQFLTPRAGWRATNLAKAVPCRFDGTAWAPEVADMNDLDGLGIQTGWDMTNRLSVCAAASLLTGDGAGHQLKINKSADTDTASLLFQSGWTGHAEMGLAGDTGFSVKISADGSNWLDAMRMDPVARSISFAPDGTERLRLTDSSAQLDLPLSGKAVVQSRDDTTPGRLLKVGTFGLGQSPGAAQTVPQGALTDDIPSGFYQTYQAGDPEGRKFNNYLVAVAAGANPGSAGGGYLSWTRATTGSLRPFVGSRSADGTKVNWERLYGRKSILGKVHQSGGVPTGAIIEQGSNRNGEYTRFADGTQICTRSVQITVSRMTPEGNGYTAKLGSWSFPAQFSDNNYGRSGSAQGAWISFTKGTQRSSQPWLSAWTDKTGTTAYIFLMAVGRWY